MGSNSDLLSGEVVPSLDKGFMGERPAPISLPHHDGVAQLFMRPFRAQDPGLVGKCKASKNSPVSPAQGRRQSGDGEI